MGRCLDVYTMLMLCRCMSGGKLGQSEDGQGTKESNS